jgi:predicted nucleotidyltransferase component of viral defense system
LEIVSPLQKEILKVFGDIPDGDQFYLTGGTALAYFYLKHRKSNDLDFFTPVMEILTPFSFQLEKHLSNLGLTLEKQRGFQTFVEFHVRRGAETTIIQLAHDSPFRLQPVSRFAEFPKLNVDNLTDIAANKLMALFSRAALRDFVDVYSILKAGKFSEAELIANAQKKDPGFDLYWLAVAFERLRQFKDDAPDMLLLEGSIPLETLKSFFAQWQERLKKQLS